MRTAKLILIVALFLTACAPSAAPEASSTAEPLATEVPATAVVSPTPGLPLAVLVIGYVGYEEGGQLSEAVRRRPYSVVLFDEIEKAHADVFNVLLQILDDGRLTDSQGRVVDFRNTVIIMTSNIGGQWILEQGADDWAAVEARVREALRAHFRPEFLNRVDDTIVFRQLAPADLERIVDLQLTRVAALMAERKITLDVSPEAKRLLASDGYDPAFGARPLKRSIQRLLQNPLALAVLEGRYGEGDTVRVDRDGTAPSLTFAKAGTSSARA